MNGTIARMMLELRQRINAWTSFRTLAQRLFGDVTKAALLAGAAASHPAWFLVSGDGAVVKLTSEGVRLLATLPPPAPGPTVAAHEAAWALRSYAEQLRPLRLSVDTTGPGRLVRERYLHEVKLQLADDDVRVADDTPVTLVSPGRRNDGHVVGVSRDEAVFYVAFFEQVLPIDTPAILEVNRSAPLFAVADHLAAIDHDVVQFERLITASPGVALSRDDSEQVARHLASMAQPWTRLLWGPPGAGKTRCVATFTRSMLLTAPDERVLLVAPSNVAVDAALIELMAALDGTATTRDFLNRHVVARFGYSRDKRVLAHHELFGSPELEELSDQILANFNEQRRREERGESAAALAELKAINLQLQQERRQKMKAFLSSARVVATTIASALATEGPVFEAAPWQTIIVDEASMISGASALLLASCATRRFLVAGDPRQLGPILEWRTGGERPGPDVHRWCATDPYELAGISTGSGLERRIETNDARLARILSQRRCHPDIWSLAWIPTLGD